MKTIPCSTCGKKISYRSVSKQCQNCLAEQRRRRLANPFPQVQPLSNAEILTRGLERIRTMDPNELITRIAEGLREGGGKP